MYIVLDCGHSKNTSGKRSPKFNDGTRFYEYEYNRILGKLIGDKLTELGVEWCFTYNIDDEEDMSLTSRAAIGNEKAKIYGKNNVLFISIHHNAFGDGEKWNNANGWEVWTTKGDTISDKYADYALQAAKEILPIQIRGKFEHNFTVLYKTLCPSILIEYGFYTNKEEVNWLMSAEGLQANCDATIKFIEKCISNNN